MVRARKTFLSEEAENRILEVVRKPFRSEMEVARDLKVSVYHVKRIVQTMGLEHNRRTAVSKLKGVPRANWTKAKVTLPKQEESNIFENSIFDADFEEETMDSETVEVELVAAATPTPVMSTGRQTLGTILEDARLLAKECQALWDEAEYRVKILESFEGQDSLRVLNKELRLRADRLEEKTRASIMSTPQDSAEEAARRMEAYKNANAGLMGDKGIS